MGKKEILDFLNYKACSLFNCFFTTAEISTEIKESPSNVCRDLKCLLGKGSIERNTIYGWKAAYRLNPELTSQEQNKKYIEELNKCQNLQ